MRQLMGRLNVGGWEATGGVIPAGGRVPDIV
jgi:hypothetical protein